MFLTVFDFVTYHVMFLSFLVILVFFSVICFEFF